MLYIKVDFHVHAIGEGVFHPKTKQWVENMVHAALQAELNGVAITDHNDVLPGLYAQQYVAKEGLPIIIIPGCEIQANEAHLLAINVSTEIPADRSYEETIAQIHSLGGLAVAPHPYSYYFLKNLPIDGYSFLKNLPLDGFERYNGSNGCFECDELPFADLAGSDAHTPTELLMDSCWTLVEVNDFTLEGILEAIRMKRTQPMKGRGFRYNNV